jgi:hypothetical protein
MNELGLDSRRSKNSWNVPVQKDVQICVVGKVFQGERKESF